MRNFVLSAAFLAFTLPAHAADPIGFLDLGDAQASTSRPSLFSGEGQRADTAMPSHPAERGRTPSRTPSKPDTPTPEQPEPEVPTKPDKPDRGDKPGKGKDKDRDHGKHGGKSKGGRSK